MVRLGSAQKAAHNQTLAEARTAARGVRTATTSSSKDTARKTTGYRSIRTRKVKIKL